MCISKIKMQVSGIDEAHKKHSDLFQKISNSSDAIKNIQRKEPRPKSSFGRKADEERKKKENGALMFHIEPIALENSEF